MFLLSEQNYRFQNTEYKVFIRNQQMDIIDIRVQSFRYKNETQCTIYVPISLGHIIYLVDFRMFGNTHFQDHWPLLDNLPNVTFSFNLTSVSYNNCTETRQSTVASHMSKYAF